MAKTTIAWGDPRAVKRWGTSLAVEQFSKSYFEQRFIGTDQNKIIQRKTDLESDAGDTISFDLSVQLRGDVTYGDNRLEGKEEQLRFFTDEVKIDQVRKAVSAGGKMTRQRTVHDLRATARNRASDYWAQYMDEVLFVYLSGARGVNLEYVLPPTFNGCSNNPVVAPDATHYVLGGQAVSPATMVATDTMSRDLIEQVNTKATMLRSVNPEASCMVPVTMDGTTAYVCLMSPYQAYDLKVEAGTTGWMEIQKAIATNIGNASPIVKGGLGMIGGTILHQHQRAIRFNNFGAGQNVPAARALFMGAQAGVVAYGQGSGAARFFWNEDMKDYQNEPTVASGTIFGVKKATFNGLDFGVMAMDTAYSPPKQ